ncbi:MAG: hypothetical protein ACJAXA_000568 [Candidatus Aldehydirespiratoraceae bacterium]|jgi:hypothetical protein
MATDAALHLAESIVAEGFDSFDAELAALLAEARGADVSEVLLDVAGDRSAPTPVRERALGRLIVELFRPAPQASFGHSLTTRAHCVAA